MVKLTVDGQELEVAAGSNVLQACEQAGREIPRFCYHERLSVAGNCRMCLVEVKPGPPKPMASCALPVSEGMQVFTDTDMMRNARRGVMEFLLINHPLDCPICDQGGECDLQDQSVAYGRDASRYAENKRSVKDKNLGPLVKTTMTRCIQCTRCIRFATEIAGTSELGATARGEDMEITTYVEHALTSELSGNLVDVCPVGALTSKPYAFVARPWELRKTDSIDVFDAVGTNIRVDVRGSAVLRVLPRLNEDVNEEWVADKARHAIDGLSRRRLDRPWLRQNGTLRPATWAAAFDAIAAKMRGLPGERIGAIAGDLCDAESMMALRDLMASLGSKNLDCRQDGALHRVGRREFYLFNSTIAGIEEADAILLIGTNPRHEAAVLNARIRKAYIPQRCESCRRRLRRRSHVQNRLARRKPCYPADADRRFARFRQNPDRREKTHDRARPAGAARCRRHPRRLVAGERRRRPHAGMEWVQRAAQRGRAGGRTRSRLSAPAGRQRHRRHDHGLCGCVVAAGCGRV